MPSQGLIIFDLVSTLTDAGPRYAEAYVRACDALGLTPPARQDILRQLGNKNLRQIISEYNPEVLPENCGTFMNLCNETCDNILYEVDWIESVFPNVRESLSALQSAGWSLGIFTGTREDALEQQLRYQNVTTLFTPEFIRAKNNERDGDRKSDELKYEQLTSITESYRNAFGNEKCYVVGDSLSDFQAAQRAGLSFMCFSHDPIKTEQLRAAGVANFFTDFRDLESLIAGLTPVVSRPSAGKLERSAHRGPA